MDTILFQVDTSLLKWGTEAWESWLPNMGKNDALKRITAALQTKWPNVYARLPREDEKNHLLFMFRSRIRVRCSRWAKPVRSTCEVWHNGRVIIKNPPGSWDGKLML